jgi:hypothetical protein
VEVVLRPAEIALPLAEEVVGLVRRLEVLGRLITPVLGVLEHHQVQVLVVAAEVLAIEQPERL